MEANVYLMSLSNKVLDDKLSIRRQYWHFSLFESQH